MYNDNDIAEIVQKITSSKKYGTIYAKTVEHTVRRCLEKYDKKQVEKKARTILHQIWSAYYNSKTDFENIFNTFVKNINNGGNIRKEITKILAVQSSTRERLTILENFYGKIFDITGNPHSIIDHACGLNPLSVLWMGLLDNTKYYAFDIESNLVEFLESVIGYLGLHDKMEAQMGDILVDEFNYADVVLMLKFLPVIEQQEKGSSLKVMKKQRCKYLVVSFPVKSLSGAEKGMASFYSNWFKNLIKEENWQYNEILFDSELVFVVQKHLKTQI